jgi:alanine racemase
MQVDGLMRRTSATVRLGDIASNYQLACERAPSSRNIAVIKANAYGHGMVEVARHLKDTVPAFAVAFIDEAVKLRDAGIDKPILILQGVNASTDLNEVSAGNFWLLLNHQEQVDRLIAAKLAGPIGVWLKMDTGMHRLGFAPEVIDTVYDALCASPNIRQGVVLCTHFACADDPQHPMTREQIKVFRACSGKYKLASSLANSAGILFWPDSHAEWNRPGYMLYGLCPSGAFDEAVHGLQPAMTMNSEIISIRNLVPGDAVGYGCDWVARKNSRIGTVAIGYGDGYPRHAPAGTPVWIKGARVPLAGRVSMDLITVDLTGLDYLKIGDPVELWGQNLSVNEVAACAGTIGYELLAGLSGRVPVRYQP